MDTLRKPFQGVWNIVRFNWHFYLFASIMATVLLFLSTQFDSRLSIVFISLSVVIVLVNLISLLISYYVYDTSDLYELPWLTPFRSTRNLHIVNINAGFDETSSLITKKFNECHLKVLDFYDPKKHTEVSVKRARKAYPPYPKTISVQTDKIEMQDASTDMICAILSAHEIRNQKERVQFFRELKRILNPEGRIFVTEHLRDIPNFLAYTIGFFHFHSKNTWLETFKLAELKVSKEVKTTPFISTFILEHATTT